MEGWMYLNGVLERQGVKVFTELNLLRAGPNNGLYEQCKERLGPINVENL
jgi:hypothetical protein